MSGATAFILAAGLGTRLRPLTDHTPKPLLPVKGRPLLDHVLDHARAHGHEQVVVNAHWLAPQLVAWAASRPGVTVVVEPAILGTGGGLKNAQHLLADRFVVLNGDILCDVDLTALISNPAPAVMALRRREGRHTAIAAHGAPLQVTGIAGVVGEPDGGWHFTGVHALDRAELRRIPDGEACIIRTVYRELVHEGKVGALDHPGTWTDIGTHEEYERVR